MPADVPPNVKWFDLGPGGLSMLLGMQLGEALNLPIRNATVVIKASLAQPRPTSADLGRPRPTSANLATVALKALRFMFDKWPRLVAEYKPTFGALLRAARRRCPSELFPRALSDPPPRRRLQQVPQRLQPLGVPRDRGMRVWEPAVPRL